MARYSKVRRELWNRAEFSGLSDNGKLAYFLISTSPQQTPLGAMRATVPGLAAELGWSLRRFRPAFVQLVSAGLVEADESASYIGLPDFFDLNRPENPNVLKSWISALELLPACAPKERLYASLKALAEELGKPFAKAFHEASGEAPPKGLPKQEQEQEQEQEEKQTTTGGGITTGQLETLQEFANRHGLDLKAELAAARDWHRKKGRELSFQSALNWLKRSAADEAKRQPVRTGDAPPGYKPELDAGGWQLRQWRAAKKDLSLSEYTESES